MLIIILYMLYALAYAVLPFLYKTQRPAMLQFYLRMAWSRSFRRCYSLGMLATLMVFHFYHLNVFGNVHELALSSLACLALYSHKNTERAFDFLQRKRRQFWVAMAAVMLLFVLYTLPLGVTLATLLFGAAFYPSQTVRAASPDKLTEYLESPRSIVEDYFGWQQNALSNEINADTRQA